MFRQIIFRGRIVAGSGKPVESEVVRLSSFRLETNRWNEIAKVETGAEGKFEGDAPADIFGEPLTAPAVRLVLGDTNGPVIATAPQIRFDRRSTRLSIDFGEVTVGDAGATDPARGLDISDPARDEIVRLKADNLSKDVAIRTAEARVGELSDGLRLITSERDAARADLDRVRNADDTAPLITDLAGSIGAAIASEAAPQGGFRIAEARVRLKGYIAGRGSRFRPLDAAEVATAEAAAASEIDFHIVADAPPDRPPATTPDLIGLTPQSARRLLRALGYSAEETYRPGAPAGAIVAQNPQPDEALPQLGEPVRIMVAAGPLSEE